MSTLHIDRPTSALQTASERWWTWNPARPTVVAAPVGRVQPGAWWRWNPYRRSVKVVEAEGRREGYVKGVQDERRVMARRQRRRGHPIIALIVLAAAASGIGFLGLAYETGSFAAGGAVVDSKIAEWRADVLGAAGRAGDQGGHAVQTVGQSISIESQHLTPKGG